MTKIAINGFGRIGRQFLKALIERHPEVEIVALNDLADPKMNAHLFKHDSNYGKYRGEVSATADSLIVDGRRIKVLAERDPAKLPWKDLGIDPSSSRRASSPMRRRPKRTSMQARST